MTSANCRNLLDLLICYSFLPNNQVFSTCISLIVWANKLAWLGYGDNVAEITGLLSCIWLCMRKWNQPGAWQPEKSWNSPGKNTGVGCQDPGNLPYLGIKPRTSAMYAGSFTIWTTRENPKLYMQDVLFLKGWGLKVPDLASEFIYIQSQLLSFRVTMPWICPYFQRGNWDPEG